MRKLVIIKNPKEVKPNMFGGRHVFVSDFNNEYVELSSEAGAMDFSARLKMAGLFLKLHPKGYKAFWMEEKVQFNEANTEMFK